MREYSDGRSVPQQSFLPPRAINRWKMRVNQIHGGNTSDNVNLGKLYRRRIQICSRCWGVADGGKEMPQPMKPLAASHRFVYRSTRLTIFLLITLLALAGMLLTHRALFVLIGGRLDASWGPALVGVSMMSAAFVLARFRNDLVDD